MVQRTSLVRLPVPGNVHVLRRANSNRGNRSVPADEILSRRALSCCSPSSLFNCKVVQSAICVRLFSIYLGWALVPASPLAPEPRADTLHWTSLSSDKDHRRQTAQNTLDAYRRLDNPSSRPRSPGDPAGFESRVNRALRSPGAVLT